jgi:hypothetical protein
MLSSFGKTPFGPMCTDHRTYYFLDWVIPRHETPFRPMCIDHQTYARVAGRPLLCQGVGDGFSL